MSKADRAAMTVVVGACVVCCVPLAIAVGPVVVAAGAGAAAAGAAAHAISRTRRTRRQAVNSDNL